MDPSCWHQLHCPEQRLRSNLGLAKEQQTNKQTNNNNNNNKKVNTFDILEKKCLGAKIINKITVENNNNKNETATTKQNQNHPVL